LRLKMTGKNISSLILQHLFPKRTGLRGFNKISFGVQSFSSDILKVNGWVSARAYVVKKWYPNPKVYQGRDREHRSSVSLYGDSVYGLIENFGKAAGLGLDTIYIRSSQVPLSVRGL